MKNHLYQSFKVPCESDYRKILKPIIIPGIDLDGNLVYEEELKMKNSLINNQPVVKLAELKYSSKKLIKLTLLDENGNILQEAFNRRGI